MPLDSPEAVVPSWPGLSRRLQTRSPVSRMQFQATGAPGLHPAIPEGSLFCETPWYQTPAPCPSPGLSQDVGRPQARNVAAPSTGCHCSCFPSPPRTYGRAWTASLPGPGRPRARTAPACIQVGREEVSSSGGPCAEIAAETMPLECPEAGFRPH